MKHRYNVALKDYRIALGKKYKRKKVTLKLKLVIGAMHTHIRYRYRIYTFALEARRLEANGYMVRSSLLTTWLAACA